MSISTTSYLFWNI